MATGKAYVDSYGGKLGISSLSSLIDGRNMNGSLFLSNRHDEVDRDSISKNIAEFPKMRTRRELNSEPAPSSYISAKIST